MTCSIPEAGGGGGDLSISPVVGGGWCFTGDEHLKIHYFQAALVYTYHEEVEIALSLERKSPGMFVLYISPLFSHKYGAAVGDGNMMV